MENATSLITQRPNSFKTCITLSEIQVISKSVVTDKTIKVTRFRTFKTPCVKKGWYDQDGTYQFKDIFAPVYDYAGHVDLNKCY